MSVRDESFISGTVRCHGRFFAADASPAPCVVIAHGFDGVCEQALENYAARFSRAGVSAFVFDYRHFGHSEGEPRQRFNIRAQLDDWRAAIAKAQSLEEVDSDRIALWGTSTSGGHVIKLAAEDDRYAAVVTQMPFTSGLGQLLLTPITHNVRLLWAGLRDQVGAWLGRDGVKVPAAGRPYTLAVVTSPDALSGLAAITPTPTTCRNEVYALIVGIHLLMPAVLLLQRRFPGRHAPAHQRPTGRAPSLVVIAHHPCFTSPLSRIYSALGTDFQPLGSGT